MNNYSSLLRRFIFSFLTFGLLTFVFSTVVMAVPVAGNTVKGKIKTSSNANAAGASVSVICNTTTILTTSDSNGNFEVLFNDADCPGGGSISVSASLNGENGFKSDTAQPNTTDVGNVVLAAVAVPEFGLVTGLVAAAGSALAYFGLRRKMA